MNHFAIHGDGRVPPQYVPPAPRSQDDKKMKDEAHKTKTTFELIFGNYNKTNSVCIFFIESETSFGAVSYNDIRQFITVTIPHAYRRINSEISVCYINALNKAEEEKIQHLAFHSRNKQDLVKEDLLGYITIRDHLRLRPHFQPDRIVMVRSGSQAQESNIATAIENYENQTTEQCPFSSILVGGKDLTVHPD